MSATSHKLRILYSGQNADIGRHQYKKYGFLRRWDLRAANGASSSPFMWKLPKQRLLNSGLGFRGHCVGFIRESAKSAPVSFPHVAQVSTPSGRFRCRSSRPDELACWRKNCPCVEGSYSDRLGMGFGRP
jgi:hypothetical protein